MAFIGQRNVWITNPGEKPLHEAVAFRQTPEGLDRSSAQQAEIAGILRNFKSAEVLCDPVEISGSGFFDKRLAMPFRALPVNCIVTLFPKGDHLNDEFRRILQIRIQQDDGIGVHMVQPRRHRSLFAEVAAQVDVRDTGIHGSQPLNDLLRPVRAPVIHKQDFPLGIQGVEYPDQPPVHFGQARLFIVNRNENGNVVAQ